MFAELTKLLMHGVLTAPHNPTPKPTQSHTKPRAARKVTLETVAQSKKKTKAPTKFLREIERVFSPLIYEQVEMIAICEGEQAAIDYLLWNVIRKLPV